MALSSAIPRPQRPWFRTRPRAAVGVAIALYAAVLATELAFGGSEDAIAVLCVLPTALLAVTFGLRAGTVAGLAGVVVLASSVLVDGQSFSPFGWTIRAAAMVLLGALLGSAVDSLRAAATAEQALVAARLREREAAEINDSIVQGLAAAKWSLEAGNRDGGLQLLTETMERAETLVDELLRGRPLTVNGTSPAGRPEPLARRG